MNFYDHKVVYALEVSATIINLIVFVGLTLFYIFDKIKWELFYTVIVHLQFIAIVPLLDTFEIKESEFFYRFMQYIVGPPDLFAYQKGASDYIER